MNRLAKTVVVLAAAGVLTAGCAAKNNSLTLAGGSASPSASSTGADQQLIDALKQAVAHAPACKTYFSTAELSSDGNVLPAAPGVSYLAPVATGSRYTGDSIDTPLTGTAGTDKFKDLAKKICTRPYVGYSFGTMLYGLQVGQSGKTVGDLTGLGPASATQINPMVKQALASTTAWASYEDNAAKVVSVLNLFNIVGAQSPTSVWNAHFANGGIPDKDGYPVVEVNPKPENLPALILALKNKGQECELARIGANLKDSRPEVFTPQGCAVTPPPKQTPPPPKSHKTPPPKCVHNCHTTPPGCTTNCHTTPPVCTTNCHTTPPGCTHNCTPPPTQCQVCVTTPKASQPVPTPAPNPPGASVSSPPSAQPTHPLPTSSNGGATSAPPATKGGYNGGSTTQPGQSGSPDPAAPTTDPPNTGDPGGF